MMKSKVRQALASLRKAITMTETDTVSIAAMENSLNDALKALDEAGVKKQYAMLIHDALEVFNIHKTRALAPACRIAPPVDLQFQLVPVAHTLGQDDQYRIGVYRSSTHFVQLVQEREGTVRMTVNRTSYSYQNGEPVWDAGISWDDLQAIKDSLGFAERDGVEIYPRRDDIVNVANMRHLWILPDGFPLTWRRDGGKKAFEDKKHTYPDKLPCLVELHPGIRLHAGVSITALFLSLTRRAKYHQEREAMTIQELAESNAAFEQMTRDLGFPVPNNKQNGRAVFICKGCEGIYAEPVSRCDCGAEPDFYQGYIVITPEKKEGITP